MKWFTAFCNWVCRREVIKEPHFHVAVPTLQDLERQTHVAKAELEQQRIGTQKESSQRQRILEDLDLELRLLRLNRSRNRR